MPEATTETAKAGLAALEDIRSGEVGEINIRSVLSGVQSGQIELKAAREAIAQGMEKIAADIRGVLHGFELFSGVNPPAFQNGSMQKVFDFLQDTVADLRSGKPVPIALCWGREITIPATIETLSLPPRNT